MAFFNRDFRSVRQVFKTKEEKINESMMVATINMTVGLICLDSNDNKFLVYALNEVYLKSFNFDNIVKSLTKVNDDEI